MDKLEELIDYLVSRFSFLYAERLYKILSKKEIRQKLGYKRLTRKRFYSALLSYHKGRINGKGDKYPFDNEVEREVLAFLGLQKSK